MRWLQADQFVFSMFYWLRFLLPFCSVIFAAKPWCLQLIILMVSDWLLWLQPSHTDTFLDRRKGIQDYHVPCCRGCERSYCDGRGSVSWALMESEPDFQSFEHWAEESYVPREWFWVGKHPSQGDLQRGGWWLGEEDLGQPGKKYSCSQIVGMETHTPLSPWMGHRGESSKEDN